MTLGHYVLQRLTAALMAPLLLGHLALIIHASSNGLSAAEILARTRGSAGWAAYYGLLVLSCAIHASIGVRVVLAEWTSLRPRSLDALMWACGMLLLVLGTRAIAAVVMV